MRKQLLLAVLLVAALAVPAFASVQNIKISGDVDSTFLHRKNFDLGAGADLSSTPSNGSDHEQNNFFTQTRLRADADLSDNVSATVGLINERSWNNNADGTDGIDINLAFVTLREMLYSPLTVVVGRQVFSYGNSLVMDATGTNNSAPSESGLGSVAGDLTKQTAMDAIRAILNYDPLKLEFLYSKVSTGTATGQADRANDDVDLYGFNATYNLGDDMKSVVEAYFFAKKDRSKQEGSSDSPGAQSDTIYLPGLRASTNILDGLNIQGEFAWQRGTKAGPTTAGDDHPNQRREAYAAQFIANYSIPVAEEYKPNAQYVYTWVSGDSNTGDTSSATQSSENKWTAWDPFFENQGGGKIYNAIFNLTNMHIHSVALSAKPMEDVTVKGSWTGLWLDHEFDCTGGSCSNTTLVTPDSTTAPSLAVTNDKSLGNEFDVDVTYDYTEDVQLGLSLGWFNPGDAFTSANDDMASQAIVHGNVSF